MKKINYLLTLLLVLVCFSVEGQLSSVEEYYKFDEPSGSTTAIDVVNNNNSTSVSATAGSTNAKFNTSYLFNGTSNFVTFADPGWSTFYISNFSISVWVYPTSFSTNWNGIIGGETGCFVLGTYGTNGTVWAANNGIQGLTSGLSINLNTWNHLAVTYNASSKNLIFYINGATSTVTFNNSFTAGASSNIIGGVIAGNNLFQGNIDEFGVWKTILSSSEVSQLYAGGSGLPYSSFGTSVVPTVSTTAISSITQNTASSGGNVSSDGGASVTARGVCWSTTANPTTANTKTTNGTGTGTFTSSITGLIANTTYHVRAYATNSVGIGYGSDILFTTNSTNPVVPTVSTTTISSIMQNTASSGGNVTSDGGASIIYRGVCWSIAANPTTANTKTTDDTGTGTFTSSITGLTANTPYHVRAYATNSVGTSYGNDLPFTTLSSGSNLWQEGTGGIYYNNRVGIGNITAPATRLHINETNSLNPFMIQINNSTKLLAGNNGGLSIGDATVPPANGLYVAGNVGINTSSPGTTKLFINGDIDHTNTSLNVIGDVKFESGYIDFSRPTYTVAKARISISSYNGPGGLRFMMSPTGTGFGPGLGIDALFLAPNGNVGIGTTAPSNKLTVKGEILCSKVTVVNFDNILPDFVFNNDYKLMSLNQVEKFVKENKHLPEVPTANEFKEKGMDMVEMSKILLQKIEELTLYAIQQQKQIESLTKEVEKLKTKN